MYCYESMQIICGPGVEWESVFLVIQEALDQRADVDHDVVVVEVYMLEFYVGFPSNIGNHPNQQRIVVAMSERELARLVADTDPAQQPAEERDG